MVITWLVKCPLEVGQVVSQVTLQFVDGGNLVGSSVHDGWAGGQLSDPTDKVCIPFQFCGSPDQSMNAEACCLLESGGQLGDPTVTVFFLINVWSPG